MNRKIKKYFNTTISSLRTNRGVILFCLQFLLFLFFPLFIFCIVEFISRWDLSKALFLYNNNMPLFIFSYFLIFLINSTLFLIFNRFSFFLTSLIFISLVLINKYKLLILWEPFYPADIFLHSGSYWELMKFINFKFNTTFYISILSFILFNIIYFISFHGFNFNRKLKLSILWFLLVINYYIFASTDFRINRLQAYTGLNMDSLAWRQNYNYDHNWFIGGFYVNIGNIYVKKPSNYSADSISNIFTNISSTNKLTNITSSKKPNVIVILSEAFWDINKLPWIKFSNDPLANFNTIKKQWTYWNLIVPTYWWKTVRTEFEVLTWNMMKFLPSGSIPYQQYIKKPIPSIVNEFKSNWYSTLAIHTYEKNFFNRKNTYPFLWFDKFIWQEDLTNPKYKGPFISDEEFINDLVYYFKLNKKETSKPQFIFWISMENHFTYEWNKFADYSISATWSILTPKNLQIINNYAQWISDADLQLKYLVNYLDSIDEPTYLVYFWDHLGAMWDDYYSYKQTGFIKASTENEWSNTELQQMYSTPFLIRNNFDKVENNIWNIGASYLGNYVLDIIWFKKQSKYYDFLSYEFSNCIAASTSKITLNRNNSNSAYCSGSLDGHNLLQYDILFW